MLQDLNTRNTVHKIIGVDSYIQFNKEGKYKIINEEDGVPLKNKSEISSLIRAVENSKAIDYIFYEKDSWLVLADNKFYASKKDGKVNSVGFSQDYSIVFHDVDKDGTREIITYEKDENYIKVYDKYLDDLKEYNIPKNFLNFKTNNFEKDNYLLWMEPKKLKSKILEELRKK